MEKLITLKKVSFVDIFGPNDEYLKLIEEYLNVSIFARGEKVKISGFKKDIIIAHDTIHEMIETISKTKSLSKNDVRKLLALTKNGSSKNHLNSSEIICKGKNGGIKAKTKGQLNYIEKVRKNDIVFSIGPAGTGKTFIAVALAVDFLKQKKINKIILCRPAVEAGESLGFLPGDLKEKIDPYLNPLYDSLRYLLPEKILTNYIENKFIEVAPLAYMRGRTLDDAFIILDEAQNATLMQMKMFLTRLGVGSKSIITGDVTQIDLKRKVDSGLLQAIKILNGLEGLGFAKLNETDIVRHPLVTKIIKAYEYSNS